MAPVKPEADGLTTRRRRRIDTEYAEQMRRYADREDAGLVLAEALDTYTGRSPLVLGIPRGGVALAAEVARRLGGDLDVAVAHKLGAPFNPELAIGAVAGDGRAIFDAALVKRLGVSEAQLEAEVQRQTAEVRRRLTLYRGDRPEPEVSGRVVIVVDDGVATGATMQAVLRWLRLANPERLVCAIPVGPSDTISKLEADADEVVCPLRPRYFMSVGEWYDRFGQTSDEEVIALLAEPAGGS
jgi:putative phosphoribosyl transferase